MNNNYIVGAKLSLYTITCSKKLNASKNGENQKMRVLLLLLLLLPFTITCVLEPQININNSGPCYLWQQEYDNLIKSNTPAIEILSGFEDTITLNSLETHVQFQYSVSLDTAYFAYGTYLVSIDPEVFDPKDTTIFPPLSATIEYSHKIVGTLDTVTASLTFKSDSTVWTTIDTGMCKLNFRLWRSVDNNYCSSVYVGEFRTVFVRRIY
jgi:hypothetical protein